MRLAPRFVGSDVKRLEDPRLRTRACYGDDVALPGLLHLHDDAGLCIAGSLTGCAVPKADGLIDFELDQTVTPTPVSPLGTEGAGEAGAVGA